MLSELHSLNLNSCHKQYKFFFLLHLIVAPQLSCGWRHNYSTKTRLVGCANEQSMYSLMSMCNTSSVGPSMFYCERAPIGSDQHLKLFHYSQILYWGTCVWQFQMRKHSRLSFQGISYCIEPLL